MGVNMDVTEIIKDAFLFPSKNIQILLIYFVLAIFAGLFSTIGTVLYVLGVINPECFLWGGIAVIVSILIGWVLSGYLISVIKSGIDRDEEVPAFAWWDNFITGFNNCIVSIVYFLIPALLVVFAGYLTDIFGKIMLFAIECGSQIQNVLGGASVAAAFESIFQALVSLAVVLAITIALAIVLFVIFSFLHTIAQARLANTGSLTEALNVVETAKDITKIGVTKVIAVIFLVIIIVAIIEAILSAIFNYVPILSIISIITVPYLIFFTQRAVGLLYSDIA